MGTEGKGQVTQQEVFKALKELSEHIIKSEGGLQKPGYCFNPEKMKEKELQTVCDDIRKKLEEKNIKSNYTRTLRKMMQATGKNIT